MKKNKVTGLVGTIVLHVVLLLLLLLVAISKPKAQEEGGVPVMLGKSSFIKKCNNMKVDGKRSQSQIKNGDILLSYIGLQ